MKLFSIFFLVILITFTSCNKNPVYRTAVDDFYTATVKIYTESGIHLQNAYLWCCTEEECQSYEDGRYFRPYPFPGEIRVKLYHFVYQPEVLPDPLNQKFVVLINDTTQSLVEFPTTITLFRGYEFRLAKVKIPYVP